MKNNVIFNLKQSIGIGLGKGVRIKVSEDYETGKVINTVGEIVSVVLKNDVQIERFEASFSDGFMTIQKRGLNKEKVVAEDENLKKQWNEGEMGYITVFAHNLFDASKSITIKEGEKIYFGSSDVYLTQNDGNLKIKDRNNNEISLSDIASKTGQNNKVSISDEDVNNGFLKDKLGKGFKFGSKVDIDYETIDFSGVQEENISENTFVLTENKRKVKIFKKENLNLLNEKIGNIEVIAGESINRGDPVYFYPDKDCKIFESNNTLNLRDRLQKHFTKIVQKIRINNSNFKISQLAIYKNSNSVYLKIYRSYNFSSMTGSNQVYSENFYTRDRTNETRWFNVELLPNTDYYIELEGIDTIHYEEGNVRSLFNTISFSDGRGYEYNGGIHNLVGDHQNYRYRTYIFVTGIIIKTTKPNIPFKNIDTSILGSERNGINVNNICYDGVALTSALEGQNIIVKADGFLPKNIINFSGKTVGNFFGNYVKIGVSGDGKTFKDFIK